MSPKSKDPILHYTSQGSGPAVILIHGLATSHHDWEAFASELSARGYQVFAVDMFGHGDSPKPNMPKLYNFKVVFGTLMEWIDSLEIERPFALVGHSMGGYMSLMYALRRPDEVRCLSLLAPLYSLKQLPPFMINTHRLSSIGVEMLKKAPRRMVEVAMDWFPTMDDDYSPAILDRIAQDVKRASPNILKIASSLPDLTDELVNNEVPSQVMWGNIDGLLNPGSFPQMVDSMPYAIGHVLPNRGHMPHLRDPERVHRLITEFLAFNDQPPGKMTEPAWQRQPIEKYRAWFQGAYLQVGEPIGEAATLPLPVRRSKAEKKANLMGNAETLVDKLLDWQESMAQPTLEQIEDLVLDARGKIGVEMATVLLEDVVGAPAGELPACPRCGAEMHYSGQVSERVETQLGALKVARGYLRCPECGKKIPLEWGS